MFPVEEQKFYLAHRVASLFVGNIIASILYGVTCAQALKYIRRHYNIYRWLCVMVSVLWLFDTVPIVLITHALYYYLITEYGYPAAIEYATWSFLTQIIITVFFILLSASTGFAVGGRGYEILEFERIYKIEYLLYAHLTASAITDIIITIELSIDLSQSRRNIERLVRIGAFGFLTSLTAICNAALLSTLLAWLFAKAPQTDAEQSDNCPTMPPVDSLIRVVQEPINRPGTCTPMTFTTLCGTDDSTATLTDSDSTAGKDLVRYKGSKFHEKFDDTDTTSQEGELEKGKARATDERFPNARITLLEKQRRLGGWVRSEQVELDINTSNSVSLTVEAGPRTLRPNSKAVLELINVLDLKTKLLATPRTSPAAKNRYIYLPCMQPGLTNIPTSVVAFLRSPLRNLLLPNIFSELLRSPNRTSSQLSGTRDLERSSTFDESLDSFLSRRFGPEVARVFGSALCHGVYAADSRQLSVRSAFPSLYDLEERGDGRVVLGILKEMLSLGRKSRAQQSEGDAAYELGDVEQLMRGAAVYSFRGGLQTLTDAMVKALASKPNVNVCLGEGVNKIEMCNDETSSLTVHTSTHTLQPTHIVSCLPLSLLNTILPSSGSHARHLPYLTTNPSSSVTVCTMIFAAPPNTLHPPGFGYLIPRPPIGYSARNDILSELGVLGTVFDSCALPFASKGESEYTKLTLMLGGPYPVRVPTNDDELLSRVLAHLTQALQRPLPPPVASRIWRRVNCIPTPLVGHVERMEELRSVLRESDGRGAWRGRLEVVGAGVGGVSVGDCIEAGRRVGAHWV
ncbi:hypothetical protein H0H92_011506 [Tricholoma furcatifolium]|nr:hypothetical protein H0H92_011506 [Tricholoma furcatifolium]